MLATLLFALALAQASATDSLTLHDALARARVARGQMRIAGARVGAARAEFRQAGTIPNPSGSYSRTQDTPRQHVLLDQSFDWLLTRGPARSAALQSVARAEADSTQFEADLAAEVRRAYFGALAARASGELAEEQAAAADTLAGVAERRFASGDISRFEADQAVLEAKRVRLILSRVREAGVATRAELARSIGWLGSDLPELSGQLPDGLGDIAPALPSDPDIPGIRAAVADSAGAILRLRSAQRSRIPLPSLQAGADWADPGQPGQTLSVFGLSLPLPLWNQGGGAVALARAEAQDAAARTLEARLSLRAALTAQAARVREASLRALMARDSLLPAARQLRERASLAYQAGETGILPVLEALRAEREISSEAVAELLTFQEAIAEWNRLAGLAR